MATVTPERSLSDSSTSSRVEHIVIVGGGFAGLYAAQALSNVSGLQVTLIDKRNFHLFQPLLYQVATGGLSPGDIASPLRGILSRAKNIQVLLDEVKDIDPDHQRVTLRDADDLIYDHLIIATGVSHHYFGKDWGAIAPGLKTIEDALEIRRRIFLAFEAAEQEPDPMQRQALQTFVVVGGGPTGVELAGALAELAHGTLKEDFRSINTADTKILLLEGQDRILPPYPPELSLDAERSLQSLGVTIQTSSLVTDIQGNVITIKQGDQLTELKAQTVLWAAGVKASSLSDVLAERTGATRDRAGRIHVNPDFSLPNYANIFVVGDLCFYPHQTDSPLPGIGAVAMQEGDYVARLLKRRHQGKSFKPFRYMDYGSMAVIGRHAAIANIWNFRLSGILAWFIWVFVHIYYLIEFDNKLVVMIQWGWTYLTHRGGARLITGKEALTWQPNSVQSNGLNHDASKPPDSSPNSDQDSASVVENQAV